MKRAPWLAVPIGTVDGLICIFEKGPRPWPREAAALDLARHLDLASTGRAYTFPSRRSLAARWGWTEASVRGLLVSRHEWSDPTKEPEKPNARPKVAQRSPKGRPPETVAPQQSGDDSPTTRPKLAHYSPKARPDDLPDFLENVAFEYGLSEAGTTGDTTTSHNHNQRDTYMSASVRDLPPDPTLLAILLTATRSHPMPANLPGDTSPPSETDRLTGASVTPDSNPTTDTDAIDNDGAQTPTPGPPAPSLTEPLPGKAASATSDTSAPPAVVSGLFPGGASTTKKGKKPALDLDAWGVCCQSYDTIAGKTRRWDPARGDGRLIAETLAKQGQARIVARFSQAARDPWCLDRRPDVSALCRAGNGLVARLDAAAEQATLDAESRSDASQTSGAMATRLEAQNASQGRKTPNGGHPWSEVLRGLGSDPQHHPEDGPYRHDWQVVRQAVIVTLRKPGDPWMNWCKADDPARQRVESLLERGLVK